MCTAMWAARIEDPRIPVRADGDQRGPANVNRTDVGSKFIEKCGLHPPKEHVAPSTCALYSNKLQPTPER
jgi:hypothetical protein